METIYVGNAGTGMASTSLPVLFSNTYERTSFRFPQAFHNAFPFCPAVSGIGDEYRNDGKERDHDQESRRIVAVAEKQDDLI